MFERPLASLPPLLACALAVYQVVLHIYPASFRRTFGHELSQDFQLAMEECWHESDWMALLRLWRHTAVDVVRSALVQWAREGWPVGALFVTPTVAAALGASWHVYRGAWSRVRLQGEDDVAIVLVAASTVLLLLVCTLVFTAVIIRPHRRARH